MRVLLISSVLIFLLSACDHTAEPFNEKKYSQEILIYADTAAYYAVEELGAEAENRLDCNVKIMQGMPAYLKTVVDVNRTGDIFVSGKSLYIDQYENTYTVKRTVKGGDNRLGFLVQRGNPLGIDGAVEQVVSRNLRVALMLDSEILLGAETKKLLLRNGIYEKAVSNIIFEAENYGELAEALKNDTVDLVISWRSAAYSTSENSLQFIEIESPDVADIPLKAGLLKYNVDEECADMFLDLMESEQGRGILRRYGFNN